MKKNKKIKKEKFPRKAKLKIFALFLFFLSLLLIFSFFQKGGVGGELILKGFFYLFGKGTYFLPFVFSLIAFLIFFKNYQKELLALNIGFLILVLGICGTLANFSEKEKLGGAIGFLLSFPLLKFFGFWLTQSVFLIFLLAGLVILWHTIFKEKEKVELKEIEEKKLPKKKIFLSKIKSQKPKVLQFPKKAFLKKEKEFFWKEKEFSPYPLNLLEKETKSPASGDINRNSKIIQETLANFGILAKVVSVNVGPTVTQYELKPAKGIKLSKITALNNNLALALASHPLRIEAPIPGKSLVGIEVPNKERGEVRLRSLLERKEFQREKSPLVFALGRDVGGKPLFANLAKMPHLLVGGATGTGKTIFLNALILSLIWRNSSKNLRLVLVDPKRVEFRMYQALPHLLGEVIFDVNKTLLALKWLIREMERRFQLLSLTGSRNIIVYNYKQKKEKIPYIVVIVDELADLMVAKGREMEAGIVRLAQMARAVGIHLVVATQRPSVEVLTGLIKANITTRIAFQVATQVDSRTILDMAGAEKLLGAGDMLFLSAQTPKPKRIQAPFVSDREIERVVNWFKEKEKKVVQDSLSLSFLEEISKEIPPKEETLPSDLDDALYEKAKEIVLEAKKASASLLQRRLKIGYARAARLIDMLEARGIVGPAEGSKPRKVYGKNFVDKE